MNQLTLNSSVWGSNYWSVLYCLGLTYPDFPTVEQKNKMSSYLLNLRLPCDTCQLDYEQNSLTSYPVTTETVENRNNLLQWICNIKNIERIKNNITPITPSDLYSYWCFYDKKSVKDGEYFCCDKPPTNNV